MDLTERLEYLEECNDSLRMQNRVLAVAFKALLKGLPQDIAQDVVENIQAAFEDEIAELEYSDSNHVDLFHDITHEFFREKRYWCFQVALCRCKCISKIDFNLSNKTFRLLEHVFLCEMHWTSYCLAYFFKK